MPSTILWRGDSQIRAQVDRVTITGMDISASGIVGQYVTFTINGKDIVVTVTSTTYQTIPLFLALCVAAIGDYDNEIPEFAEISASITGNYLHLTGPADGTPFTCTVATSDAINVPAATASYTTPTSPNFVSLADNYSGGVVPVTGDTLIVENSDVDLLYGFSSVSSVVLAVLRFRGGFSGRAGLPPWNPNGYWEYRDLGLPFQATKVYVDCPSQRIYLNLGAAQNETICYGTGDPEDPDIGSLAIKGSHASNVLRVIKGDVSVARVLSTDTATIATLQIAYDESQDTDSRVQIGAGTTLGTVLVSGGENDIACDFTSAVIRGGKVEISEPASPGTLDLLKGEVAYTSSGTLTQGYVSNGGKLVFDRIGARTCTDLTVYAGAEVVDEAQTVTFTNPIEFERCSLADVKLDLGVGRSIQPS